MTQEEKIKEIVEKQMQSISQDKMFSIEECLKEYGQYILEEAMMCVPHIDEDYKNLEELGGFHKCKNITLLNLLALKDKNK